MVAKATIGLVLAGVGTAGSIIQGARAAKAQNKALERQQRADEIRAHRERVTAVREARIRSAQVAAERANTNVLESSGAMGGMGSLSSQAGAEVGYINQIEKTIQEANVFMKKSASAQQVGSVFSAIGSVGSNIFDSYGGYKEVFKE